MKRAPRSRQRHDLYAKYHDYDSEISDLLGECGFLRIPAAVMLRRGVRALLRPSRNRGYLPSGPYDGLHVCMPA